MTNTMDFTVKGIKTIIIHLLHMVKDVKENTSVIGREVSYIEIN